MVQVEGPDRRTAPRVAVVAAILTGVAAAVYLLRGQLRPPVEFLPRPVVFVTDIVKSEDGYDLANPSIKGTFLKGLKERDWAKVRSALAPGFAGRFPAVGAGRLVPDPSVGIREIGNENLPDLGADAFVQVLRAHVEPWSVVERTMWRPWEFLLAPDGKSAFVSLHFEVGGRRPDGARSDLYGTLRGRLVSADGKTWQIHRLEWVEGTRVDATRPPWEDITDATGLHFNESEAAHKLRQSMVNDRGVTNSGGLVVTDWNGDGFPDILANVQGGLVALFVNDGKGGFVRGKAPDIAPDDVGYAFLSVDLDGDGVEELVSGQITTGAGGKAWAPVYRRRGDGWECLPHALEMDVPESLHDVNVMGIVPGDFDGDGDLDLLYCCYSSRDSKLFQFNRVESYDGADNYLFVNQGGLRFTEESDKRGITGTQYTYVAKWWDFDFDGDLDLFEGNDYGPNHLWVNDGKGQFKDAKDHIFDADTNFTMGVTLADWENDGVWGMYISNIYSHAGNRVFLLAGGVSESTRRLGLLLAHGNQFYECDPATRKWRETSVARKVNWADWAWGCVFFDLDNDMDKDLFVANGYATNTDPNHEAAVDSTFIGSWSGYERDFLFYNTDGPSPTLPNVAYLYGVDFDDDGRAACPVDIDGDGDLDLVEQSLQGLKVIENTSPPRHFLRLRLEGNHGVADALNAMVKVVAGGVTQQDYAKLTDGFNTQVPFEMHFGLGDATRVDQVIVTWPGGERQICVDLPADKLVTIRRGREKFEARDLPRWPQATRPAAKPTFSCGIVAKRLDGTEGPLASSGKPAVVNFWAPSCAPCKQELPLIVAAAAASGGGVQFVGVSTDVGDTEAVKSSVAAFGMKYPQFLANEALIRSFFGPAGQFVTPSTFVFDSAGRLRRVFQRPLAAGELEALLDSLREEPLGAAELDHRGAREHELGHDTQAVEWLKKALAANPDRGLTNYHMGLTLLSLNRPDEGLVYLRRATELDPTYWSAWFNLGAALHNKGEFQAAVDAYQNALKYHGGDAVVLLNMGSSAARANQAALAFDCFERAVAIEPGNAIAWGMKGELHYRLGQVTPARECFRKALAIDPNESRSRAYTKELEKLDKEKK